MDDDDDDSFDRTLPGQKNVEPEPDSDDSFDNFDPTILTQVQKKPIVVEQKKNSSFVRHGSDNSFFRGSQITNQPKPLPKPAHIQLNSQMSVLSRPSTPNGEMLMIRSQLDKERRDKEKINMEWQKTMKEITDKHSRLIEEQRKTISRLEKEKEILEIGNSCRRMSTSAATTTTTTTTTSPLSTSNIRKVFPTTSRSILRMGAAQNQENKCSITPIRSSVKQHNVLSAFRHQSADDNEMTFPLEESFAPEATSTPRIPHVVRNLRRAHEPEQNKEPPSKKKVPRKPRSRQEIQQIRQKLREKIEEKYGIEKSAKPANTEQPSYLEQQLKILRISKENEKIEKLGKSKIREICAQFQKPRPPPKCAQCRCEPRERREKRDGEKEWVKRETQRNEKKRKEAEIPMFLMYSTMIQNVSKRGFIHLEKTKEDRKRMEEEFSRKCAEFEKIRSLEQVQEEKRQFWRDKMMRELNEKGEMAANIAQILDEEDDDQNDDYIWTSSSESSSESSPEFDPQFCAACRARRKMTRRQRRREAEKFKIKIECFEEFGKEQRELLRNQSILTKSKIEAADRELFQAIQNDDDDEVL